MTSALNRFALFCVLCLPVAAHAQTNITMNEVTDSGVGKSVGTVTVTESKYGVVFAPSLSRIAPGTHGFHIHENPSCMPKDQNGKMVPALAAGGHYDPAGTRKHGAPWGDGHLGDLPPLVVDTAGNGNQPVLAPRLKLADIKGRSLMVHAGGDNHADQPAPLGGGGARIACGVIQ